MSKVAFSPIGGPPRNLTRELASLKAQKAALAPIRVTPKLAAPEMHTEPGKHLVIFLQRLAVERNQETREQLVLGALNAAHAMDQAAHVAKERIEQIQAVGQFLIDQGLEKVFLDGAPDIVLDMLTDPEATEKSA